MPVVDIDKISKQVQDYYKETPVIILGSGASVAFKMTSMLGLAEHLTKSICITDLSKEEQESWGEFCDLIKNDTGLEAALHKITLSPSLTQRVLVSTWELLVPQDLLIFNRSLNEPDLFPLGKLLKHMFRSTRSELNIITPNYDRLAEYACEQENLHHYSGFSHGYRKTPTNKNYLKCSRQVNIWKVHGSLDWFANQHGVISSLGNIESMPNGLRPLIVTPGVEKYRDTHKEPYKTTIHNSDDAIDAATSYMCIGFGFNDEHIQEKLVNRCDKENAKIIVITYKLSSAAKKFLFEGNVKNYVAIEAAEKDVESIVHSSLFNESVTINDNYWSLEGFLKLIM